MHCATSTADRILTDDQWSRPSRHPSYPIRRARRCLPALHVVHERLRLRAAAGGGRDRRAAGDWPPPRCRTRCRSTVSSSRTSRTGDTRVWVCRSISCALRGGEELLEYLCQRLGIQPGETTPDGRVTLEFAECLGACDFAPCMLAGERCCTRDHDDAEGGRASCELAEHAKR